MCTKFQRSRQIFFSFLLLFCLYNEKKKTLATAFEFIYALTAFFCNSLFSFYLPDKEIRFKEVMVFNPMFCKQILSSVLRKKNIFFMGDFNMRLLLCMYIRGFQIGYWVFQNSL